MDAQFAAIIRQHPLLQGLSSAESDAILAQGRVLELKKGQMLVREGDEAKEFFFILEGILEVYRQDVNSEQILSIASFQVGDVVGEVSLLDRGVRSANIIAKTDSKLFAVPFSIWYVGAEKNPYLYQIFFRLAQNLCVRLRNLNEKSLQVKLNETQERLLLGRFFVYLLGVFWTYIYVLDGLRVLGFESIISYLQIPFSLFFLSGMLLYLRKYRIPLAVVGITTQEWRRSLYEGFVFTIPVLGLLFFLKWAVVEFNLMPNVSLLNFRVSLLDTLLYLFFSVPLQEFIVRGGIQGLLSRLLVGDNKNLIAIMVSSLMFSASHLFISFYLACSVLVLSIFFGWIYARNKNLISVWVAHSLVGIWWLDVFGF